MTDKEIAALIYRRRQQILVHSVLYYRMNENLIDDATWSKWAVELEKLQNKYPDISKKVPLHREFENFDHSTGSDLPLDNPLWREEKIFSFIILRKIFKLYYGNQ